ncbi:MAG: endonuclease Q family protein [Methanotrichaceae archaeon]
MRANLDLHIHSRYSTATSKRMDLPTIAREAAKKGIKIVATGDCLHPKWLAEVKQLQEENGLFILGDTSFVLTTEVEDPKRAHHLILVPDISEALELREKFSGRSADLDSNGRPSLRMTPPEIADAALEAGCLIGPAHAFTPWTGMYAHYASLKDCYGDQTNRILYLELGLSADSDYADRISELRRLTFLTNSDAHSPWSNKLGREFNQTELGNLSFKELKKAIKREAGRGPTLNVGFYPEEGKYNQTACSRCYKHYTREEMTARGGRCECGGIIKLGVKGRVEILADSPEPIHPDHRPPYLHLIPLAEIIAMALGHKSIHTAGVQKCWNKLIAGRSEIEVLVEADLSDLDAENKIIEAIQAFRSGDVIVKPGGGGKYGEITLPENFGSDKPKTATQQSLFDF